jgi:hypothetical protein
VYGGLDVSIDLLWIHALVTHSFVSSRPKVHQAVRQHESVSVMKWKSWDKGSNDVKSSEWEACSFYWTTCFGLQASSECIYKNRRSIAFLKCGFAMCPNSEFNLECVLNLERTFYWAVNQWNASANPRDVRSSHKDTDHSSNFNK